MRPERQFQQVGAEIIGSENYKADVEIINLAYDTLKKIGVKNIVIELSAPFFLESIFNKIKDTKIKKQFNWRDDITVDEGVNRSIRWIKANLNAFSKLDQNYQHKK